MATSLTKLALPARRGQWGIRVDRLADPREVMILRYFDDNLRHSEPCEEVARVPYSSSIGELIGGLTSIAGLDRGIATILSVNLAVKLASPHAASAGHGR